ncbi:ABC1 kinase family protein [Microbacterium flavum]|uniref:AarF/ABC1/UbiB kinase family protein n=1 Tax=Microbacterium flavum TaxID=415216 RepID=A0ABS5XXI7_9MICO|nr:AarF/UbiB family protein [Microbacterium flavum]MBT8799250.1 AarF/ABC1/UbiB kinase family protein [Microbacterium flavum]
MPQAAHATDEEAGAHAPASSRSSRARYNRILRFATGVMIQAWWFEIVLPRVGLRSLGERSRTRRLTRMAARFRVLAVELGGLMIKVGQFLSARLDVLPPEITVELEQLQDEVPAVAFAEIRALAEAELGTTLGRAYDWFDETPVAAASLGQAHRARLSDEDEQIAGFRDVVVKVQRPGIDRIVATDLAALRTIGARLSRIGFVADRVDAPALVEEFATTSLEEIDYLHEGVNAERFAATFARGDRVDAPTVVWERTTRRVLTLSDVTAIKLGDVDALRAAGIDPAEVAQAFAGAMFDQLFGAGFFHADPHPGNVFVTPHAPDGSGRTWSLTFIDFGMMGQVPEGLRDGLRRIVIAVAARDGRGLVDGIERIGVLLPGADTTELERALTALFARFGGIAFGDLQNVDPREFRTFADDFGEAMRSLPVQLPENFLLITRAVSLTSGVCSALDPSFNVWEAIDPYAQQLLREESRNAVTDVAKGMFGYARTVMGLPPKLDGVADRIDRGSLSVATPEIDRRFDAIEALVRRTISAVVFAALLVGGVLLLPAVPGLAISLMIVSVVPLAFVIAPRRGSGRRRRRP